MKTESKPTRKAAIQLAMEQTSGVYCHGNWWVYDYCEEGHWFTLQIDSRRGAQYDLAIHRLAIAVNLLNIDASESFEYLKDMAFDCFHKAHECPNVGLWTRWLPKASESRPKAPFLPAQKFNPGW